MTTIKITRVPVREFEGSVVPGVPASVNAKGPHLASVKLRVAVQVPDEDLIKDLNSALPRQFQDIAARTSSLRFDPLGFIELSVGPYALANNKRALENAIDTIRTIGEAMVILPMLRSIGDTEASDLKI